MSPEGSSLLFRSIPKPLRFESAQKRALKKFAQELSQRLGDGRPFCCLITNDEALRILNRDFRKKDQPTDVLSFPATASGNELGELAISVERADEQARRYGHDLVDEVRILMLHGVLHLAGMDHERDRGEMARAEQELRIELKLPANLISRASR